MWVWTTMYIAVVEFYLVSCTHIKSIPTTMLHLQREPLWYCTVSDAQTRKCTFIAVMAGTGPSNSPLSLSLSLWWTLTTVECYGMYVLVCVCLCMWCVYSYGYGVKSSWLVWLHLKWYYAMSQSTVVLCRWGLGPLCLYIWKFQFALSLSVIIHFWHHRMIAEVNMYVHLKVGWNWTTHMGDMSKSPILLVIVVLVLQFESHYLKNRKRYMSEVFYLSRVRWPDMHWSVKKL